MRIRVHARPRAREESVKMVEENTYRVSVKEPPAGGRANEAICRALAEHFDVPKTSVQIISGATSRNKIIEIAGL